MVKRMSRIRTHEVSLVRRGANRKKFAVTKSENSITMNPAIQAVLDTPAEGEDEFVATLKSEGVTDEKAVAARVAHFRLTNGLSDLLPTQKKEDYDDDKKKKSEDPMAKLKKMADRMKKAADGESDDDLEEMAAEMKKIMAEAKKATAKSKDDNDVPPQFKSLDPEAIVQAVTKSLAPVLKARNDEIEALKGTVAELIDQDRTSQFTAKAAGYTNVPAASDELALVLKSAHDVSPDFGKQLEGILDRVNAAVGESPVFKSLGSNGHQSTGGGSSDAWSRINQLAEQMVQKSSDKKMTLSTARSLVLKTDEGRKLYREYLAENPAQRSQHGV